MDPYPARLPARGVPWAWCIASLFTGAGVTAAVGLAFMRDFPRADHATNTSAVVDPKTGQSKPAPSAGDRWKRLAQGIAECRHFHSEVLAGKRRSDDFYEMPEEGVVLVGLHCTVKPGGGGDVIDTLQPIYRGADGERTGVARGVSTLGTPHTVKAKEGFVVAAVDLRIGEMIAALNLTYARWDGTRLDLADSYQSGWVGGKQGSPARLGGDGKLIIGVWGFVWRNECTGLGVLTLPIE